MATVDGPPAEEKHEIACASHSEDKTINDVKEEHPTESHALANADHDEKGAAQYDYGGNEARNLGWYEEPMIIPQLVGGLPNEELWALIRRFNKQIYHVKALSRPPIGGLDLNIAEEEEFTPDKLRANVERLYMTVIVGIVGFWKHVARLRSWRERKRTIAFMVVYFVAWALDFLVPTIIALAMILIVHPPARRCCFPPAPPSLISAKTGGVQKPAAGVLGSDDSLTGAPEKHAGEALEKEASNFVNSLTAIAISSASGNHPAGDPHDDGQSKLKSNTPDSNNLVMNAFDAKEKAAGGKPNTVHDKTKEPMEAAMWSKARPFMHAIANVADGWERFGNVLSPTPPFPQEKPRIKLAAYLVPLLLVSMFMNSYIFMKMNAFFIGFGLFGDPIIGRGLSYLNKKFPNWKKLLELRNSLLKGIPTNTQLTLTLLRIGEANRAPLPPPPSTTKPPVNEAHATAGQNLDSLGVSDSEMADAIHSDESVATSTPSIDADAPKKKHGRRILAFLKGTTKGVVEAMLGTDRIRAAAGVQQAKNRLGILQNSPVQPAGPVDFPARYQGKKGHLNLTTTTTGPTISWSEKEDIDPVFSIAIDDIQEIKKVSGFGWKAKMVVGWATDREVVDGILIVDKGNRELLTAVARRDVIFDRLIAIGNHMWESW